MNQPLNKYSGVLLLLLFTLPFACKFQDKPIPVWETEVLVPLLNSHLGVMDIIKDTNFVSVDTNNVLWLTYRDTVINYKLSDYVIIPDSTVRQTYSIDSASLASQTITNSVSLGYIANQMYQSSDIFLSFMGFVILNTNGDSIMPPSFSGITSDPVPLDASSFFEQAQLSQGYMDILITNNLPIPLSNVQFSIANQSGGNPILLDTFPSIPVGGVVQSTRSLAGKLVESALVAQIINMDSPGSTDSVLNDTSSAIVVTITVRDLRASNATAIFPTQEFLHDTTIFDYNLDNDVKLTKMTIKSGKIIVTAVSTIEEQVRFQYIIPKATYNNQVAGVNSVLPPAPIGGQVTLVKEYDLAGHTVDLTVDGTKYNQMEQIRIASIDSSGNMITITNKDSVFLYYGLVDIVPEYVEGFLGEAHYTFSDSSSLDMFKNIQLGTIELENPKMNFTINSSIGINGQLVNRGVSVTNKKTGQSKNLEGMPPYFDVNGPTLSNPTQNVTSSVFLDKTNFNIVDLFKILPDFYTYKFDVYANYDKDPSVKDNFATDQSSITGVLDVSMPFSGVVNNITLTDTFDFNLEEAGSLTRVKEGTLKCITNNSFPYQAKIQIYFMDEFGTLVDSLFHLSESQRIVYAGIANANGYVETPTQTILNSFADQARIQKLKTVRKAYSRAVLDSDPNNLVPRTIYSTYYVDIKLVGDFVYLPGGSQP